MRDDARDDRAENGTARSLASAKILQVRQID